MKTMVKIVSILTLAFFMTTNAMAFTFVAGKQLDQGTYTNDYFTNMVNVVKSEKGIDEISAEIEKTYEGKTAGYIPTKTTEYNGYTALAGLVKYMVEKNVKPENVTVDIIKEVAKSEADVAELTKFLASKGINYLYGSSALVNMGGAERAVFTLSAGTATTVQSQLSDAANNAIVTVLNQSATTLEGIGVTQVKVLAKNLGNAGVFGNTLYIAEDYVALVDASVNLSALYADVSLQTALQATTITGKKLGDYTIGGVTINDRIGTQEGRDALFALVLNEIINHEVMEAAANLPEGDYAAHEKFAKENETAPGINDFMLQLALVLMSNDLTEKLLNPATDQKVSVVLVGDMADKLAQYKSIAMKGVQVVTDKELDKIGEKDKVAVVAVAGTDIPADLTARQGVVVTVTPEIADSDVFKNQFVSILLALVAKARQAEQVAGENTVDINNFADFTSEDFMKAIGDIVGDAHKFMMMKRMAEIAA